jgi:hypothetical protein
MSSPVQTTHDTEAEGERVQYGKVLVISVVSLFIFAIGILWSVQIQRDTEKELAPFGHQELPHPPDTYEVGMVNMRLFSNDVRTEEKLRDQRKRLSAHGWSDKQKQLVHVPINQVMEQMVTEAGQ